MAQPVGALSLMYNMRFIKKKKKMLLTDRPLHRLGWRGWQFLRLDSWCAGCIPLCLLIRVEFLFSVICAIFYVFPNLNDGAEKQCVWGAWGGVNYLYLWGDVWCVIRTTAVKLLDVRDKFEPTEESDYFHPSCRDVRQRNESLVSAKDDVISPKGINAEHNFQFITPLLASWVTRGSMPSLWKKKLQ